MKGRTSWGSSLRWGNNIKVDITEEGIKDFDLLDKAQDKVKCKLLLRIFFWYEPSRCVVVITKISISQITTIYSTM